MPDVSALYPQPPAPSQGLLSGDPSKVIGLAQGINALSLFPLQREQLQTGVANLQQQNLNLKQNTELLRTQNAQQLLNLNSARQQELKNSIAGLADKDFISDDDLRHFVVKSSRLSDIPSPMLNSWLSSIPPESDQKGRKAIIAQIANMAVGPERTAGEGIVGYQGAAPTVGTAGQAALARRTSGGVQAPQPGLAETQTAEATAGQTSAIGLQNAANEIPTQRTQLDLMRNDLKQAETKFGPTAKYEKVANVVANRVLGFHPTMNKEEIASLESFDKVAKQMAQAQAGTLHATNDFLHNATGANPNTDLSAYGNEGIINMLHGNLDAIGVQAREWNKARASGTGPDKFYQWRDNFNQSFDPRVFQFMRMTRPQQTELLKNIPDKAAFEQRLIDADRRGWIKLPQQ